MKITKADVTLAVALIALALALASLAWQMVQMVERWNSIEYQVREQVIRELHPHVDQMRMGTGWGTQNPTPASLLDDLKSKPR
jgi:hypothetical protein